MKQYNFLFLYCLSLFNLNAYQHVRTVPPFSLAASYSIDNSWPTGYQVTVTLHNNSAHPTSSWMFTFTLGTGQTVSDLWNGVLKSNNQPITVTNPTWTGGEIIAAHSSTTFGFIVNNPQSTAPALSNLQAVANGSSIPNPPALQAPVLQPINNPSASSQFQLQWNAVSNATAYTVQQSTNSSFSNPQTVYTGSATSTSISVGAAGTYYYYVTASANNATSPMSNIVSTIVQGSTPQPPQPKQFIESYWESWNSADSLSAIVNMHVDIIDIAFANFTTTGTHTFAIAGVEADPSAIAQLVTLAHNAGKKVKIAVGGATYPLSPQLKTTQDALGMAQAIATYIQQNNLDGVDFDIEDYPAPALQISLIQQTRALLGNNALITYTPKSPASTTYPYYAVIQGAYQYLTGISIMAYDYGQGYNYQDDVQALIAMGVPASKITVGLMPGEDDLGVMTSVADITNAAHYIQNNGLLGIMFWDLNRDLENQTGLGVDAATNAAWNVFDA
ncbi:MAG TPA: glycosyl hydrolase family 18 protein [Candidatus Babeliales bacterium]|jgi:fibronectin type 3 domain-containing protein|nr:glycosyl hydrolase family 18 protein [Candidatus Babeliales bacterium]